MPLLTPASLAAAYDFLCLTPPFDRWKLPHSQSGEIGFRVGRDPALRGWFTSYRKAGRMIPTIVISAGVIGHTDNLITTMAHEMIHYYEWINGTGQNSEHSANFKRLAKRVCQIHGFDPLMF